MGIRPLFERAVKQTGRHGDVPVYVPTRLPKEIPIDSNMVVQGSETSKGYELTLYYQEGVGDAGFVAGFYASALDPSKTLPKKWGTVRLADGTRAKFSPVSCGGSCAPANLRWRTSLAEYTIQLSLSSTLSEDEQLKALVEVANSMKLSSQQ
jgi:hypothetical protein